MTATNKQVNVAVLVSGGGTNLQALIDAQNSGIIKDGKIVLVVSNKQGAYALERAKNNGIDSATVLKKDYAGQTEFEDAILALVSVEKIFRMYKNPKATEFDKVQVDAKVDDFLNKHFLQYNDYCANRKPHPEFKEYLYYTEVFEDDQYDDLTLIAIKRKK